MADRKFSDVTLTYADPDLLLCWKQKVKQGAELKHSRGKIETILKSRSSKIIQPKVLPSDDKQYIPAEKKKRKKASKKKRLEALLAFQKRLVEEKGLPPSKLMLQLSAVSPSNSVQAENEEFEHFRYDHCEYTTYSKHGLSVHMGYRHKKQQKPDISYEEVSILEGSVPSKTMRCTFCRERYESEDRFREHTSSEFSGWKDTNRQGHIKCPLCDWKDYNCYSVKKHMEEKHNRNYQFTVKEYTYYMFRCIVKFDNVKLQTC